VALLEPLEPVDPVEPLDPLPEFVELELALDDGAL